MTSYPLNDAFSELEFEDLDPWEDTRGVVPLPHGVDQHSVEGNPTNVAMWIESAKESTIWMSFVSNESMQKFGHLSSKDAHSNCNGTTSLCTVYHKVLCSKGW